MPRATLIAAVDTPDELSALEEWLTKWSPSLSYLSQNEGCGCCVHIFNVEGPQAAIDDIPQSLSAYSAWSQST